jgi:hypothetical protein
MRWSNDTCNFDSHVLEDLNLFETAAQKLQAHAGHFLAAEVRESAAGLRRELQQDIQDARLQASKIVQQVEAAYEQPMSAQKFTIVALGALLLFFCGVWAGISALWWRF